MTLKQRFGRWIGSRLHLGPELASALRFEASAWLCGVRKTLSPAYHRKIRAVRARKNLSLNVGSGGRGLPGWVNTDALTHPSDQTFPCDVRRGLPLSDASVARIFAEHLVEHLDFRHDLPRALAEFLRVLEPGGRLRIVVPDGRRFAEAYLLDDRSGWAALGFDPLPADMPTAMAMLNHVFHQGGEHRFSYDFETLEWALKKAGFTGCRRCAFGESGDPQLAIDRKEHARYSLYVEATKP